jgi:PAS domain S-box-containing protein
MKKHNRLSWLFPNCFFIFFSIYLLVKFVFIFFFSAAFEPKFIFELTPFYFLSGLSDVQLGLLSYMIILADMYLHLRSGKRNLLLSFLPTSMMLSSLGFTIMFSPMDIAYVYHYSLFGCLLLLVLIDYQHILTPIESSLILPKKNLKENTPVALSSKELRKEPTNYYRKPQLTTEADMVYTVNELYRTILQNIQSLTEVFERKTKKLEQLENEIEEKRRNLITQEEMLIDRSINNNKIKDKIYSEEKVVPQEIPSAEQIFMNDEMKNYLVVDAPTDCTAILQRGILKQVSGSFADFLGYDITELINKSLFLFYAPECIENVKNHGLDRLRGVPSNSYNTAFITKDCRTVSVEIIVKPTTFDGKAAEILFVKEVKNK